MARSETLAAAFAAMAALILVAACGGGGGTPSGGDGGGTGSTAAGASAGNGNSGNPPRTVIDVPARGLTIPSSGSVPVPADTRTGRGGTVGVGPAFRNESPEASDLVTQTRTADGAFAIRSGRWRDPLGRDGTASAGEVARFIRAFQDQEYAETGGRLVFGEAGPPKTLRIHDGATAAERELAVISLRRINTALPWNRRILLGPGVPEPLPVEEIPRGEIHIHFTDGKTLWPGLPEGTGAPERVLGIGGVLVSEDGEVVSGYAYIDRSARGAGADMLDTVTHELLHAYGLVAHVDPDRYPDSVLAPTADPAIDQSRVYLTLDGEALLADTRIAPGTPVGGLDASDLGPWETDAFHLLGSTDQGDGAELRFGAGYRNGLSRPWAYGPRPATRLGDNPALAGGATWTGGLLGFTESGRTVAGDARIGVDLADADGRADFTALEFWERGAHPGAPGSGTRWGDGDLGYTLALWEEGADSGFDSAFAPGDDPGVVTGVFTGPAHGGAAGVLEHPDLSAGFGAVRPR
ncbi:MAG: hypothetical protein OXF07_14990 [Rhodobacter sp.]|nr:hypothetical protein [Rhodobacter sp.]MCY4169358.1 hypothetical protein [Rhodobacter sp.]MCY4243286.1 hypothetical protein [Rhodobacter sp.]